MEIKANYYYRPTTTSHATRRQQPQKKGLESIIFIFWYKGKEKQESVLKLI